MFKTFYEVLGKKKLRTLEDLEFRCSYKKKSGKILVQRG